MFLHKEIYTYRSIYIYVSYIDTYTHARACIKTHEFNVFNRSTCRSVEVRMIHGQARAEALKRFPFPVSAQLFRCEGLAVVAGKVAAGGAVAAGGEAAARGAAKHLRGI